VLVHFVFVLGIDVNFWWGLAMLGFGLIMITFGQLADKCSTR
jgi:hypothetical protein